LPVFTLYALGASNITVSGGGTLSGFTQGDGSHLVGRTLTLNTNAWQAVAVNDDDANFADNDGGQTLSGAQTVFGTAYAAGRVVEAEYTLTVTDPDGNTYQIIGFNINEAGSPHPSFGTIEGLAFIGPPGGWPPVGVPLNVAGAAEGPPGTGATTPFATYVAPLCFATGTRIATPDGPRPVQTIRPGDPVLTRDDGAQPVLWTGAIPVGGTPRAALPAFRPVRIRAHAFGSGRPARDLWLSRQHRLLVGGWQAELNFGADEALAPAAALADGRGIAEVRRDGTWSFHHLLLPRHAILSAEGLDAESLLPGDLAPATLAPAAARALARAVPDPRRYGPPARPLLRRWEAALAA
jgi:hypothetical protein